MRIALVVALAAGLAAFTYLYLERTGIRGWAAMLLRAVAWGTLGLLLLNSGCPVTGTLPTPLVLLDASLSMAAGGAGWPAARDSATRWGEVRRFGDERTGADTAPSRGRSLLAPALLAASASDRPVIVVTDGEIEDRGDIPPDLLARTTVREFPRPVTPDLAITRVSGPSIVAASDSIALEVEMESSGGLAVDTATVQVTLGAHRLIRGKARLTNGAARLRLSIPAAALGPGDHFLEVLLADWKDSEPGTDSRTHLVSVAPTPGVVLLAAPGDWDSRFLYLTLREVAQLPVEGFVRLEADRWRSMRDLRVVSAERVRQAARRADLLILKGAGESFAAGARAHGILSWPSPASEDGHLPGDWYLSAAGSPIADAFLGQPIDSFPPAIQLTQIDVTPGDWVALSAQLGRRGAPRPAVVGRTRGRTRRVIVAVDGLWRWAFRGGSSEEAYRSWVAATASWLLGGADSARGVARAVRPVVPNGRPLVFEWAGAGKPSPVAIAWSGSTALRSDTLNFDGSGRATIWLPPGTYRYRLDGGGSGAVAVEAYSEELRPRPVTLPARESVANASTGTRSARDWLSLFALCVLAFGGEWLARRRLGLR